MLAQLTSPIRRSKALAANEGGNALVMIAVSPSQRGSETIEPGAVLLASISPGVPVVVGTAFWFESVGFMARNFPEAAAETRASSVGSFSTLPSSCLAGASINDPSSALALSSFQFSF